MYTVQYWCTALLSLVRSTKVLSYLRRYESTFVLSYVVQYVYFRVRTLQLHYFIYDRTLYEFSIRVVRVRVRVRRHFFGAIYFRKIDKLLYCTKVLSYFRPEIDIYVVLVGPTRTVSYFRKYRYFRTSGSSRVHFCTCFLSRVRFLGGFFRIT